MSRKKLIYLGLLGIAAAAFLVDRILLSHTETAAAAEKAPAPERVVSLAKPPPPRPAVLDPSLAWLEKLAEIGMGADAFSPSPSWVRAREAQARSAEAQDTGPAPGSAEAFESAHQLQATTFMGAGSLAVVDHRCLRIGDTVDGFRLTRVTPSHAEFRSGSETATLTLPMPPDADPSRPSVGNPAAGPDQAPRRATATRPASPLNRLLESLLKPRAR